jgi:hypothetical protein
MMEIVMKKLPIEKTGLESPPQSQSSPKREVVKRLTGTKYTELGEEIIHFGTLATLGALSQKDEHRLQTVMQMLLEEKPKDQIEARLLTQAHALYTQGMKNLARAEEAEYPYVAELRMKLALKLLRAHNDTLEALRRHRQCGEQRVVVQHVQVNDGGKAIVGNQIVAGGTNLKSEEPHG